MLTRFSLPAARVTISAWLLLAIFPATACGDDGSDGDSSGGIGGSTSGTSGSSPGGAGATAGSSSGNSGTTGGSSIGGASAGGSGGASAGAAGTPSKGGTSSTGGTGGDVEPGEPCTANCPKGTVQTCFENCPLGACDNGMVFGDALCSTLYPSPISNQTIFCRAGQTATYCLTTVDRILSYYHVSCDAGTPTMTLCDGGCGADPGGVASCND